MHPRCLERNYAHRSCRVLIPGEPTQLPLFRDFEGHASYDAMAFEFKQGRIAGCAKHFRVQSLDGSAVGAPARGFGGRRNPHYLRHELRRPLHHVTSVASYRAEGFLVLEAHHQSTSKSCRRGPVVGTSLLAALDRTSRDGAPTTSALAVYPLREHLRSAGAPGLDWRLGGGARIACGNRDALKEIADLERRGSLESGAGNGRDFGRARAITGARAGIRSSLLALARSPLGEIALAGQLGSALRRGTPLGSICSTLCG